MIFFPQAYNLILVYLGETYRKINFENLVVVGSIILKLTLKI
jgi:hypothetical protein